jgi:hypothetical protein
MITGDYGVLFEKLRNLFPCDHSYRPYKLCLNNEAHINIEHNFEDKYNVSIMIPDTNVVIKGQILLTYEELLFIKNLPNIYRNAVVLSRKKLKQHK